MDAVVVPAESAGLIDPRYLRRLCESCDSLSLAAAEGRGYTVSLVSWKGVPIDSQSSDDPYPESFWDAFAIYLSTLLGSDCALPSSGYACAKELRSRGHPILEGISLGRLYHIIQLAISHRKLLGYAGDSLVPHSRSDECAELSGLGAPVRSPLCRGLVLEIQVDGYSFLRECKSRREPLWAETLTSFFSTNNPRPESYSFTAGSKYFKSILEVQQSGEAPLASNTSEEILEVLRTLRQAIDIVFGRSNAGKGRTFGQLRVRIPRGR